MINPFILNAIHYGMSCRYMRYKAWSWFRRKK